MSKKKNGKFRKDAPVPEPQVPETPAADDNIPQPDNINEDNTQPGQPDQTPATEQDIKLSFGEKIASLFAPVRQLKEAVAEAEVRAAANNKKIEDLESQISERDVRITGLNENLNEARESAAQADSRNKEIQAELEKAYDDRDAMSADLDKAKADSFAEAVKSLPAEMQGRFSSYQDMVAAIVAYDAGKQAAVTGTTAVRSLAEILEDPSPLEKDSLLRYALGLMVKDRLIPANSTNWRVAVDSLRRKDIEIGNLKSRLDAAELRAKEAESVDREAELLGSFAADSLSDRMSAAIATWLCRRVNGLIDNEERHLDEAGDLGAQFSAIAAAVGRPGDHDEAVADGMCSVLNPLSELLGYEISSADNLSVALSRYFDERLHREVIARFTEAGEDERLSLDALVDAANAALADRAEIGALLKKLGTDRIDRIYESAISYHFEDIISKNRPDEATDEVMEAFARDKSFDAIIRHLVKAVSTTERRRAKASEEAEMSAAEVTRLEGELKTAGENRAAMEEAHKSAMAELRKATDDELQAQKQSHADALTAQKEKLDAEHAELTATLKAGIASRDADIRSLFDAYLGSVKQSLQTVADDIAAAYTGPRDDNAVADVIDHNIVDNDIYGFEEFRTNLLTKLDAAAPLTADAVQGAVRDTFTDILKIESATWIDNLARLALYSQVPFIADGFMRAGVRIECFTAALTALEAILAQGGITLQLPRLFVDRFDESLHNAEAIKNITSVVSDVASHVPDDDTVIDLFTVGYSIDGAEVRKPTVSRLNG